MAHKPTLNKIPAIAMADVKLSNKAKPDHPIRTPVRLRDDSSRPLTINLNQKKKSICFHVLHFTIVIYSINRTLTENDN